MTATKREKIIALAAAAAVLVLVGYNYLLSPYLDQRATLMLNIQKAQAKYDQEIALLKNQPKVAAEWKTLLAGSLSTTPAEAFSKTWDALYDWARSANFNLQSIKPDRPVQQGDFQQIRLQASGIGSESSVARLLWVIEASNLPLRIEDFQLNARKDGTDDLALQLSLSTLVFAPAPSTRPGVKPRTSSSGDLE